MTRPLVLFHGDCPDGFTAAWVVRRRWPEAELVACRYNEPAPNVTDRFVLLVDFSYPREEMERLADQADALMVYDHHQSAQQALDGFGEGMPHVEVVFDMERSGAGITWDELFPGEQWPDLVHHVQDRDLWRFADSATPAYMAAVMSHPHTIEAWDAIARMPRAEMLAEGRAINRFRDQQIATTLQHAVEAVLAGHTVPVVNCPYSIGSDVAGELAKGRPFAAYYWDAKDRRNWGLRSDADGLDVAEVANKFDGGGHKHAAGFRTDKKIGPL